MKKVFLCVIATSLFLVSNVWAKKDNQALKDHAYQCLEKLSIFSAPELAPNANLQVLMQNDSLIMRYDSNYTAKVDNILETWTEECKDLFDRNVYSPGFFTRSPLSALVDSIATSQQRVRTEAMDNDSLKQETTHKDSLNAHFLFMFKDGYLKEIGITPRLRKRYQYVSNGTTLFWGFEGVTHRIYLDEGLFKKDSLIISSGNYITEKKNLTEIKRPWSRVITKQDYPELKESDANGKFENDTNAFTPIYFGAVNKSWALSVQASAGIFAGYFTDKVLDDMEADRDSSAIIEGLLEMGVNWSVTAGAIHCSPSSQRCFGFGAGYGSDYFSGSKLEKGYWDKVEATSVMNQVSGLKLYGEYFFKSNFPVGVRETITIPLNAGMEYIQAKTNLFISMLDIGFSISPAQFIPTINMGITYRFNTEALF